MARFEGTEEWLVRNRDRMIGCPYQPGHLKISKEACRKRQLAGRQTGEGFEDLGEGEDFDLGHQASITYREGLAICRRCPIGGEITSSPRRRHPVVWGFQMNPLSPG